MGPLPWASHLFAVIPEPPSQLGGPAAREEPVERTQRIRGHEHRGRSCEMCCVRSETELCRIRRAVAQAAEQRRRDKLEERGAGGEPGEQSRGALRVALADAQDPELHHTGGAIVSDRERSCYCMVDGL